METFDAKRHTECYLGLNTFHSLFPPGVKYGDIHNFVLVHDNEVSGKVVVVRRPEKSSYCQISIHYKNK